MNIYPPGEGLCAHVDLPRFEDGIVSVSLAAPCVIEYAPVVATCSHDAGSPRAGPADAVHSGGGSGTDAGSRRADPAEDAGASGSARVCRGREADGAAIAGSGGSGTGVL